MVTNETTVRKARKTNIEWTDVTDNILRVADGGWWCSKISPGCAHCYAEKLNGNSFFGGNKLPYSGKAPELVLQKDLCDSWARQRKAERHFVASMTDIFGEWVSLEDTFYFLDAMRNAPLQTFQMLTKRADVMLARCNAWLQARGLSEMPSNMWCGVSVENQKYADERIPLLLRLPARVRFLSCEPLLGSVNLCGLLPVYEHVGKPCCVDKPGYHATAKPIEIHWVIVGGESGKNARPMHPEWAQGLRDQCVGAGVAFFFKQWGEYVPWDNRHHPTLLEMVDLANVKLGARMMPDGSFPQGQLTSAQMDDYMSHGSHMVKVGKKVAGRFLSGTTWSEFPVID